MNPAQGGAATEQAAPADPADEGLRVLAVGDEAWWRGDRRTAHARWLEALGLAGESSRGRALEAMARLRLLQVSGTVGPFVHERRMRDALGTCLDPEPWCAIARADAQLWMPSFTGADPARVPALLAGSPLQGPAAARIAVATGDQVALRAVQERDLDGVGRGVLATGRTRPPSPGTWTLGFGVAGAPGAGFGGSVRFLHPDLAWRGQTLSLAASADSLGGFGLDTSYAAAHRPGLQLAAGAARGHGWRWEDDLPVGYTLDHLRGSIGALGLGAGAGAGSGGGIALGVSARVDRTDQEWAPVVGPYGSAALGLERAWVRGSAEANFGAYTHLGLTVDARAYPSLAGGTLALRAVATIVPTAGSPFYRLPSAGGAALLRGEPTGRYRGPAVLGGQLEYRHVVAGPIEAAVFFDSAAVEDTDLHMQAHWTAGIGARLVLPPEKTNVTRIDLGIGPGTWGLVVGWGQAF